MCVCIKRLINSTLLRGFCLAAPWPCPTPARVVPASWIHYDFRLYGGQGHSFWFLSSWLQRARKDPERPHGPGRMVPTNIAEGEFQRESHSVRRAVACAIVLRAGEYFYFRSWKEKMGGIDTLIKEHQMSPYSWSLCCVCAKSIQLCLFVTLWTVALQAPLSLRILQARILEWVAMSSSRGSSRPKDRTQVSCPLRWQGRWILVVLGKPILEVYGASFFFFFF